ncbi:GntR family transcriptional regulator [Mesorhizobium sp. BAC0120]|uniref:GntR family transcriptional regulator n=1 Tax=Mesorhizobium sp. BAC0120 TaxID=3090670 RepID=UPI00298CD8C1|nr:GntR family transcriptional regulator [Mesorhizobium sp. BAC0120]MDW6020407.1 GntR family transcriptional regulator [Mesorhizobium sp. BAC0120]
MDDATVLDFMRRHVADENSAEPLYRRIKAALGEAIASALLKRGAVIPSERVLCKELDVSRVTVRKALDDLVAEGLLQRRHGAKTVVSSRLEKSLATMTSFSEDMRWRGLQPGCVWISKQISRPSPAEMMALGLSRADGVARLKRIRTADGTPIAIETAAVPARFLPHPEEVGDSLYEALDARGAMPVRAIQRMQSSPISEEEAELLNAPSHISLLVMERRCFLADGQIVEFTETRYRGDVYDFVIELHR